MAEACYLGLDGVARKVKKWFVGVNGKAGEVAMLYVGDSNGVARKCFQREPPARVQAWLYFYSQKTGGVPVEFKRVNCYLQRDDYMSSPDTVGYTAQLSGLYTGGKQQGKLWGELKWMPPDLEVVYADVQLGGSVWELDSLPNQNGQLGQLRVEVARKME